MADKRMLGRAVSQSRKVNGLSLKAALLWTWAIPWFDSYGYLEAEPDFIKFNILPRRSDIQVRELPGLLQELAGSGLWKFYKSSVESGEEKIVAYDPKFTDFQTLREDRLGKQRFFKESLPEYSWTTPGVDGTAPPEVKIREDKIRKNYAAYSEAFENFWNKYPTRNGRKAGKPQAYAEWKKLSPDKTLESHILNSISSQIEHRNMLVDSGSFAPEFPDACRWLKNRRWEDEIKNDKPHWHEEVRRQK
ncbi:MAG: hypothetical protein ABIJ57_12065 [Pseudomonadota bacterium]